MQQQQQKEREVLYSRKWVLTSLVQLNRRKKIYGRNHSSWTDFRIALTSVISMLPGKFLSF